jgi:hypothetical protein
MIVLAEAPAAVPKPRAEVVYEDVAKAKAMRMNLEWQRIIGEVLSSEDFPNGYQGSLGLRDVCISRDVM